MTTAKKTIENLEADVKLHQRLVQRTNQPQSYMIADIERAEKELDFAQRKIKQMEDALRKLKVENEHLKQAKRGLADDLQKLTSKKHDIENLQTTLMGIIQHSSSKKIDVDDLKTKLADTVRRGDSYTQPFGRSAKKSGRSKSPMDERETMKEETPAWYKSLKKNLK